MELEEPAAASKEAKTHLQTKNSGAGALQRMVDCSVLGRSDPMAGKRPIRYRPAFPHVSTRAGRAFVTYFAFAI